MGYHGPSDHLGVIDCLRDHVLREAVECDRPTLLAEPVGKIAASGPGAGVGAPIHNVRGSAYLFWAPEEDPGASKGP